jgi:hypothetical protein
MNRRSKLAITASAMTAALSPWYASEIASRTPSEAASDVAAEELGPERLGVRLADVEADNLAPRGLVHGVRDHNALAYNLRDAADLLDKSQIAVAVLESGDPLKASTFL